MRDSEDLKLVAPLKEAHRVLVVEDDAASRMILREWLQGSGYEVTLAKDGSEA